MRTIYQVLAICTLLAVSLESKAQWQLVWQDEFTNGISGDWVFETGAGGWGNNELQYYRRENASVQNGNLVISAKREAFGGANYTSARMKTQGKKSWKYGKIEARIAIPSFSGIWPAFWMLGDNISSVGWPSCGEIDIMEHVNGGDQTFGTIHWANANGSHAEYSGNTTAPGITNYHTYTIEWDANAIKWFVDGNKYHEANIAGGVNSTNELHNNFFILLNLAVGGNWPGFNIDNSRFPTSMLVDYVRVYQAGSTPPNNPPSGSGVATVYKDCNYGGTAVRLPAGNYAYGDLYVRGVANEDISSLRVDGGYEVVLYEHDNFTGASTIVGADNSCFVSMGWNDRTTSLKIRTKTSTPAFTRTIQAEDYSAMLGVQTEGTSDAGGGRNVGYIDNGDWMAYNSINFPTSGTYRVEYRVASLSGGNRLSLDLNAGSIQLGSVNIPSTGGWQNWTTVTQTVNVNAGTYNLGIYAAIGGFNLNWIRLTKINGRTEDAPLDENANNIIADGFGLFPNPVQDDLYITSLADLTGGHLSIYDAMGLEVMKETMSLNYINVSSLKAGVYTLVAVTKDGNKTTKRFIKN